MKQRSFITMQTKPLNCTPSWLGNKIRLQAGVVAIKMNDKNLLAGLPTTKAYVLLCLPGGGAPSYGHKLFILVKIRKVTVHKTCDTSICKPMFALLYNQNYFAERVTGVT
jgi:hypothetical protein